MRKLEIKSVESIRIVGHDNFLIVKVNTNVDGLYGLGCASFTQRPAAVEAAVREITPLVVGCCATEIESCWKRMSAASYWRGGPVLNCAIGGIDMALWDILGKALDVPVYTLLGGKCRNGVRIYEHAFGKDLDSLKQAMDSCLKRGTQYIRPVLGSYSGTKAQWLNNLPGRTDATCLDVREWGREAITMFQELRREFGPRVELIFDAHERFCLTDAVWLAKQLEPFGLFFLEEPLAPEDLGSLQRLRDQTGIPIAIGELFHKPSEWLWVISHRLVDFIRCHISQIGGITPAHKLAILAEQFGVRIAWHGPPDASPVGHMANLHLDLAIQNFGIQEWPLLVEDSAYKLFQGLPAVENGFVILDERPGLGIDLRWDLIESLPEQAYLAKNSLFQAPDGTVIYA